MCLKNRLWTLTYLLTYCGHVNLVQPVVTSMVPLSNVDYEIFFKDLDSLIGKKDHWYTRQELAWNAQGGFPDWRREKRNNS